MNRVVVPIGSCLDLAEVRVAERKRDAARLGCSVAPLSRGLGWGSLSE
jgi:hypothetical protein